LRLGTERWRPRSWPTIAELKAALAAFMRDWIGEDFFAKGKTEEDFEHMVDQFSDGNVDGSESLVAMLRQFHAIHGWYSTFDELSPTGSTRFFVK
jgi:hypothetical protein